MLPFLGVLLAAACVASPVRPANTFSPYGAGPAFGTGPVWAIGPGNAPRGVPFTLRSDGSYAAKFLWIVSPRFRSELYVDVAGGRFRGGTQRIRGIRAARWRDRPSTVIVTHPGCVRFHIGGPGLSRTITVLARTR